MTPKSNPHLLAIVAGLFFNSAVLIIAHYVEMSDFLTGVLMGVGFAIMMLPFTLKKLKSTT